MNHLFGHMDKNLVKVGDKVEAFKTPIGTIGDANSATSSNNMAAHLHYQKSEKSPEEQKAYVIGKGLKHVEENYPDPTDTDFDRMFGRKMDVGKKGYAYKQKIKGVSNSYHPGVDVNGANTSGNQDFGWQFTSPVNGVVILEERTWGSNGGWGNIIVIAEDEGCKRCCPVHCK